MAVDVVSKPVPDLPFLYEQGTSVLQLLDSEGEVLVTYVWPLGEDFHHPQPSYDDVAEVHYWQVVPQ